MHVCLLLHVRAGKCESTCLWLVCACAFVCLALCVSTCMLEWRVSVYLCGCVCVRIAEHVHSVFVDAHMNGRVWDLG